MKSSSNPNHLISISIIIILSLIAGSSLNAQEEIHHTKQPNQVRFSVTPAFFQPLQINNTGEPLLTSTPRFGGDASVSYSQRLPHSFRFNGGIGWSIVSFNYGYHFVVPPGSIFDIASEHPDYMTTHGLHLHLDVPNLTFPFSLQKTFAAKNNNSLQYNLEAGIKFNWKQNYPFSLNSYHSAEVSNQGQVIYFSLDYASAGSEFFTSYLFKAGLIKYNSRYNSWHCNLVYQYAPATIGTGYYEFYELGFESYGTFKQSAHYLGIEFIYSLTLSKKSLRA